VQNDANGRAKVALLSITRSTEAWMILASATGMRTPAEIADLLADLRLEVEHAFPDAWRFRRPGLDGLAATSP
jgi:hypothetical protein